jgi:hypothetical protein
MQQFNQYKNVININGMLENKPLSNGVVQKQTTP